MQVHDLTDFMNIMPNIQIIIIYNTGTTVPS